VITFDPGVTGTINLTGALPDLGTDLEIQGPGADMLTVRRDTDDFFRIFHILSGVTVTIDGLEITNGRIPTGGGGCMLNEGALSLMNSTVSDCGAKRGGGIRNLGVLTIENSTFSGNVGTMNTGTSYGGGIWNGGELTVRGSALFDNRASVGAGIYNESTGVLTMENSTLSKNRASSEAGGGDGGGLYNFNGVVTVESSTISGNIATSEGGGIFARFFGTLNLANTILERGTEGANIEGAGPVTSLGYNLCDDDCRGFLTVTGDQANTDPLLGDLTDNGGPTETHLPLAGSPAIDAGSCQSGAITEDQRGQARPYDAYDTDYPNTDDGCDIGAVELQLDELVITGLIVTATLWLEGPYSGSGMDTNLSAMLPQNNPYSLGQSVASTDFFTTDTNGQQVVDWLWLELRSGDPAGTMTTEAATAALLMADGSVKSTDATSDVTFVGVDAGSYYLVVGHRTHLAVMTPVALDCTSGVCSHDFTTAQSAAYTQGSNPLTDLSGSGAGLFALIAADGSGDGLIGAADQTLWLSGRGSSLGYHDADHNLDGLIGAADQTLWLSNRGRGSQVPATDTVTAPAAKQVAVPLLAPALPHTPDTSSH
ncbi:MAG TPA: right-handed parallel beta-helix repeat-containing protein, partial [Rhodothermales bacterium]|nr:right-handed parallel beta-helix repeat-containing protein [Rhodothermales bacterium]